MRNVTGALAVLVVAWTCISLARAEPAPDAVRPLLPPGYDVITAVRVAPPGGTGPFLVVALAVHGEGEVLGRANRAPARPLLLFRQGPDGRFTQAGRNDTAVFRRDDGGQCDPFEENGLAAKGTFFTVQNGVACGAHWTDFVTFRFDAARKAFLFHSRITESWRLNPSNAPNAQALVLEHRSVQRADPRRPVTFDGFRP